MKMWLFRGKRVTLRILKNWDIKFNYAASVLLPTVQNLRKYSWLSKDPKRSVFSWGFTYFSSLVQIANTKNWLHWFFVIYCDNVNFRYKENLIEFQEAHPPRPPGSRFELEPQIESSLKIIKEILDKPIPGDFINKRSRKNPDGEPN